MTISSTNLQKNLEVTCTFQEIRLLRPQMPAMTKAFIPKIEKISHALSLLECTNLFFLFCFIFFGITVMEYNFLICFVCYFLDLKITFFKKIDIEDFYCDWTRVWEQQNILVSPIPIGHVHWYISLHKPTFFCRHALWKRTLTQCYKWWKWGN